MRSKSYAALCKFGRDNLRQRTITTPRLITLLPDRGSNVHKLVAIACVLIRVGTQVNATTVERGRDDLHTKKYLEIGRVASYRDPKKKKLTWVASYRDIKGDL